MKRLLNKLFPSLAKKTAVAVATVFLVAGGAFVYVAQKTGYEMLEKQTEIKAHGVAQSVKGILEEVMMAGRNDLLQGAIESATRSSDIVDVLILRADRTIALRAKGTESVNSFPLGDFREDPRTKGETFVSTHEHDSLYEYIVTPIVKKPECAQCHKSPEAVRGYIAMKIAMDDIRAAAGRHRTTNIMMTVLTFAGLGIIIYAALLLLVIRPLARLRSHIRRLEEGVSQLESGEQIRFPLLRESDTNDEIADLCRSFNNLVRRLNDANAAVFEMHQLQLAQANRLASTGEMAASMAHEIKNPIAGVLGALQVIDGEVSGDDPRKEILSEMMTQLERVDHAVNDLLSYARPAAPRFQSVNLRQVIQKVITLLRPQVRGRDIAIAADNQWSGAHVEADPKQLQQVFWNILQNALQSIEFKGEVSIAAMPVNSSVRVEIQDTGKGIPQEQLEHVFKPFFTTRHKGTGLGMTISKNIIEQHGGTIAIESEIGRGTTVSITIPLHQNHGGVHHAG